MSLVRLAERRPFFTPRLSDFRKGEGTGVRDGLSSAMQETTFLNDELSMWARVEGYPSPPAPLPSKSGRERGEE
jgi:hypothetical protein